ncbi:helix-turn-helix domain-containing protein [Planctomycetota bacterium]
MVQESHEIQNDTPVAAGSSWTEARLLSLDAQEHDYQEFKGSAYIESAEGTPKAGFSAELSKQVSAFANGGGGRIFIGLDDEGCPDGGVLQGLKNGTREWLEDVIPGCVSPALSKFNVYEVRGSGSVESRIGPNRAVFVVDIPTSANAPHQAKDYRYYLRIAGKSRPMGHLHVLDVLGRQQHPEVSISGIAPYGEPELSENDPRGPRVLVRFRAHIANRGTVLAQHAGAELLLPRWCVSRETRTLMSERDNSTITQHPGDIVFFFYHPIPLFPTQEVVFSNLWIVIHGMNYDRFRSQSVPLRWRAYADNAAVRTGRFDLARYAVVQRAIDLLSGHLDS